MPKKGKEDIFKPTFGDESLHEISKYDGSELCNIQKSDCRKYSRPTSKH
jgi:hypothetical protein